MIYSIIIKNKKVISSKNEEKEWVNGELRLVNYCLADGVSDFITHDYLDTIQNYYNRNYEHCCWNFSKKDYFNEKGTNYAKITIDGETRYYEEW